MAGDDTLKHHPHTSGEQNARVNPFAPQDPREIIRRLRDLRGFKSDRALAIAAGMPQPTLSRYLAGKSGDMELAQWRLLAEALEVSVSHLLGEIPLTDPPELISMRRAMEKLPQQERDALVAAANAMAAAIERRAKA